MTCGLRPGAVFVQAVLVAVAAACGTSTATAPGRVGPSLRTFSVLSEIGGRPVLCTLGQPVPPLVGSLEGSATDRELVWLRGPAGQRISVVWPDGFSVRFEPKAVLYNEKGTAVARDGDTVGLQAAVGQHAGTFGDPFFASGAVLGGCYPRPSASG